MSELNQREKVLARNKLGKFKMMTGLKRVEPTIICGCDDSTPNEVTIHRLKYPKLRPGEGEKIPFEKLVKETKVKTFYAGLCGKCRNLFYYKEADKDD